MRISTSMINNNHINGMLRKQTELHYTSQQLGTGKRVLTPSDDPVASTLAYNAKNKLANIEQYTKNIDYAEKSLRNSEAALDSIHNRLSRVRQLMIQANNDTLARDGRRTIGLEMSEITSQLEKLVNSQDEQGNYIFAGSKVNSPAFVKQSDGSYAYQGDSKERDVQVSESVSISLNMTGKEIFKDIPSSHQLEFFAFQGNSTENALGKVSGDHAFLPSEKIGDYIVEVASTGPLSLNITDPRGNIVASGASDLTALDTFLNAGDEGSVGNLVLDDSNLAVAAGGDKFVIRANNEKQDILTGIQRLTDTLLGFSEEPHEASMLEGSLDLVDSWLNSVEVARTEHGSRRNGIESVSDNNENLQLFIKEQVSNLEDLDYASAIGEFTLQQTALQASQQIFSQVSKLSLFNFIR